jgi:hypothetical protein
VVVPILKRHLHYVLVERCILKENFAIIVCFGKLLNSINKMTEKVIKKQLVILQYSHLNI